MTPRTTLVYSVDDGPNMKSIAASLASVYTSTLATVWFAVRRPLEGNATIEYKMDNCWVLGCEYVSVWPLTVSLKLYYPTPAETSVVHNISVFGYNVVNRKADRLELYIHN